MNTISYRLPQDPASLVRYERFDDVDAAEERETALIAAGALDVRNLYRGPCSGCGQETVDRDGADVCPRCAAEQRAEYAGAEFTASPD